MKQAWKRAVTVARLEPAMLLRVSCVCLLLLCGMFFSGCAAGNASAWREYKVFCGMSSKNGDVSEEAWKRFCDEHVSAAFPDGYTVLNAAGYWRSGPDATSEERSRVILIVAPAAVRDKVLSIARQYQRDFGQSSVLVSCSGTEMELVQEEENTSLRQSK